MRLAATLTLSLLLLLAALPMSTASAEQRYVGDEIHISFRGGPGTQYEIYRFLSTGTPLQVLEIDEEIEEQYPADALEDWIRVVDPQGEEGWVQERFLMAEPPARERIGAVEEELAAAEDEIAALEAELADSEDAKEALEAELAEAEARIEELEADLEAASEGYELVEANEQLQDRVEVLLERKEELEQRNQELTDRSEQEWFLAGAGVLVGGVILGLILPRLRPRRRSQLGGDL